MKRRRRGIPGGAAPIVAALALILTALSACGRAREEPPPFEEADVRGVCAPADGSAEGILWGRVESADTTPLEGAQVFIRELGRCGALTDAAGRFVLEAVPEGTHVLVFQLLGYETDSSRLSVADDSVHASVRLRPMKVKIDDMIVRPLVGPPDSTATARPPTDRR